MRALLKRTDTKFLMPRDPLDALLARVTDDYALLYAKDQAVATYRTLYFDTPKLRCFHDHRRGRRARHKMRVRHYVDRESTYLEVKTKTNHGVTAKARLERPFLEENVGPDERQFAQAHLPFPSDRLEPVLATDFARVTLLGLHTEERVTIDFELRLKRGEREQPLAGLVIVEVKQTRFSARTPIMKSLRMAGVRPRSASKYCTGMLLTGEGLPANQFLPALRAIEKICA